MLLREARLFLFPEPVSVDHPHCPQRSDPSPADALAWERCGQTLAESVYEVKVLRLRGQPVRESLVAFVVLPKLVSVVVQHYEAHEPCLFRWSRWPHIEEDKPLNTYRLE